MLLARSRRSVVLSTRSLVFSLVWLAASVGSASRASAADADRGAELYELCTQCHGVAGEGNQAALAPGIAGLPEWYVLAQLQHFKKGERGMHPEDTGGLRMYPMSQTLKTPEDMQAVAAFVAAMPKVSSERTLEGGDATRGAQLYTICVACHGPDGAGNEALGSPPIAGQSDWYLLSSLQKLKSGHRGTYPNAVVMRGMAGTLTDEQAMKDVIAHIMTLHPTNAAAAAPNH
jgi:cytochrome c oxidase subunit 2